MLVARLAAAGVTLLLVAGALIAGPLSPARAAGLSSVTDFFVPGTDPSMASVEVQNRIKRVEARLPRAVIQQGILIEEASSAVLQIITLRSTDGKLDEIGLGDFMVRDILGEIRRIPGVGRATLFSTERALRVWIDPDREMFKLSTFLGLTQPEHTYWYIEVVPELLQLACERAERNLSKRGAR